MPVTASCYITQVYRTLVAHHIPVPKHIIVERSGLEPGDCVSQFGCVNGLVHELRVPLGQTLCVGFPGPVWSALGA